MIYSFHHIHLICKDLENMIDFFTGQLGANLIGRKKFGTADGASLDLQGTTVNLRVARDDEDMSGDASQPRFGYDHIGLQVDDVDAAFQELKANGFSFFMEPRNLPDLRIAFFRGPEDIIIELVQDLPDRG
ncbi:MAG: VOC family protein [Desulfobacterales bacterium]|nr:VOC family protein [Desulfobacterales bacterium]